MPLISRINPFSKQNNDTGFGVNAEGYGGRFINRDGTYNLRREGHPFFERFSVYHMLLSLPGWQFIAALLFFFLTINLLYTGIYLLLGAQQLQGIIAHNSWERFKELYFFSTETFTTVGYGRINPVGDGANLVAAIEAMSGFLSFAIATGLIYGRFSKPRAHLLFSDHAIIGPYKDGQGLKFRLACYKENHTLSDLSIQVNLGLQVQENGASVYKFYELALERKHIQNLPMNWTVVHPIDENSPLLGLTEEDMQQADVELYVMLRGFNDVYSNYVAQRTSYTYDEIKHGRKFVPMYRESHNGKTTILELQHLHKHIPVGEV